MIFKGVKQMDKNYDKTKLIKDLDRCNESVNKLHEELKALVAQQEKFCQALERFKSHL